MQDTPELETAEQDLQYIKIRRGGLECESQHFIQKPIVNNKRMILKINIFF